jgi:hypothetical protein
MGVEAKISNILKLNFPLNFIFKKRLFSVHPHFQVSEVTKSYFSHKCIF